MCIRDARASFLRMYLRRSRTDASARSARPTKRMMSMSTQRQWVPNLKGVAKCQSQTHHMRPSSPRGICRDRTNSVEMYPHHHPASPRPTAYSTTGPPPGSSTSLQRSLSSQPPYFRVKHQPSGHIVLYTNSESAPDPSSCKLDHRGRSGCCRERQESRTGRNSSGRSAGS